MVNRINWIFEWKCSFHL